MIIPAANVIQTVNQDRWKLKRKHVLSQSIERCTVRCSLISCASKGREKKIRFICGELQCQPEVPEVFF